MLWRSVRRLILNCITEPVTTTGQVRESALPGPKYKNKNTDYRIFRTTSQSSRINQNLRHEEEKKRSGHTGLKVTFLGKVVFWPS